MMNIASETIAPKGPRRGKPAKNPALVQGFVDRLNVACNNNPNVPPMYGGRYEWIVDQLNKRFRINLTKQSVGKWFVGENMPTPTKCEALAEVLGVDAGWLQYGSDMTLSAPQRRMHNALVSGTVNLVAGMIQMDGGAVAFPEDESGPVQITAIIRGVQYGFHVALGERTDAGLMFRVPQRREAVIVLGLVRDGFDFVIYEIPEEVITEAGRFSRGMLDVLVTNPEQDLRRIETFRERL